MSFRSHKTQSSPGLAASASRPSVCVCVVHLGQYIELGGKNVGRLGRLRISFQGVRRMFPTLVYRGLGSGCTDETQKLNVGWRIRDARASRSQDSNYGTFKHIFDSRDSGRV